MSLQAPLSVEQLDTAAALLQATIVNLPSELHTSTGLKSFIASISRRISPRVQLCFKAAIINYTLRVKGHNDSVQAHANHCRAHIFNIRNDRIDGNMILAHASLKSAAGYLATMSYRILKAAGHKNVQLRTPAQAPAGTAMHASPDDEKWKEGCAAAAKDCNTFLPLPYTKHLKRSQKFERREIEDRFAVSKAEIEGRADLHKHFDRVKGNLAQGRRCGICYEKWSADRTKAIASLKCCGGVGHRACLNNCRAPIDRCPFCRAEPMRLDD